MDRLLDARELAKAYGSGAKALRILDGISFSVSKGEFVSIVGPSGCGKTTLLMALAGLMKPDSGSILFQGTPLNGPSPGISVVFQDYSRSLFPWKTNLDNILFGMIRNTSMSRADKRRRGLELMDAVGLKGFDAHYPWQLSGGMQQRVAIARGLAAESELLLLDEPLAAVDAQTRADMQDLLLELAARFNQTCILVTHDVDEAVYMADRVVVLTRRPTRVDHEIPVDLGTRRDQITTREDPRFLEIRHDVMAAIRRFRAEVPLAEKA